MLALWNKSLLTVIYTASSVYVLCDTIMLTLDVLIVYTDK